MIVFTTVASATAHEYWYARWNGRRWERRRIVDAGGSIAGGREMTYSGGISLDHEDPSVVLLSRKIGAQHEVQRWRTPDGGRTWARRGLTTASPVENVRPVTPRGQTSYAEDLSVLWMRGNYNYFTDYRTALVGDPASGPAAPTVYVALSPERGPAPLTVELDAGASHDPGGAGLTFDWDFGDGARAVGQTISHTYSEPGRYWVRLTLTDAAGGRDVAVREVVVG